MSAPLDTLRTVETPEGIDLELRVAGPLARGLAWGIDLLIRLALYLLLIPLLAWLELSGIALLLIAAFVLEWLYPVLFEVYRRGATPGKAAMGLQVLHDDGTPVGWPAAMVRNLLRGVDFLPLFNALGLIACLLNRDFKRLGDLAAGTLVVYRERRDRRPAQLPPGGPESPPLPPPLPLTPREEAAVVRYAERLAGITPERAEELAGIVAPLTGGGGTLGVQRLVRIAHWLVGRR